MFYKFRLLPFCIFIILGHKFCPAQTIDCLDDAKESDSTRFRCGMSIVPGIIFTEAMMVTYSFYASRPKIYGDKVIGGIFAGGSIALFTYLPFYLTNKEYKKETKYKIDRLYNSLLIIGTGYGCFRIAKYNLLQSKGENHTKRFIRNFSEFNLTCIIPLGLGLIASKIANKMNFKKQKPAGLTFNGTGLTLNF